MNLFELPERNWDDEFIEALNPGRRLRIERIVSKGHVSPAGYWYEQERDEWVLLLQGHAILEWKDGRKKELNSGDWLLIPALEQHRVEWTSVEPPCIWLAVHGDLV